ncbi:hypothetical protein MA6G0728R_4968 [Mycobacteroides abscessus 6G-0728-R]|uniref:Uncharacterized protein n=1 Tax=Mycobacteroides abscessus 1948 TaxID=1299323 RepID=A0A829QKB1_9MYCO|nr:hypothetical protein MA6G0728S_4726 [Mycobacteroides abscessus 6G-0728-S]EIU96152.1 hypothetical protein MA6G0728R_4968 [Mycobacteroides abscessus 6G-0728-R]EIV70580.1 hypothetical protein MM3A0810R_5210 [Mycobacteroides abscessus 3A-0810-R]EUA63584.1 hypothetical protein I542_3741 [Mycobacteroides abscessus 1948]
MQVQVDRQRQCAIDDHADGDDAYESPHPERRFSVYEEHITNPSGGRKIATAIGLVSVVLGRDTVMEGEEEAQRSRAERLDDLNHVAGWIR